MGQAPTRIFFLYCFLLFLLLFVVVQHVPPPQKKKSIGGGGGCCLANPIFSQIKKKINLTGPLPKVKKINITKKAATNAFVYNLFIDSHNYTF